MPIRSKDNFLIFGSPVIGEEEIEDVVDSMRKGWLGTGPKVHKFQKNFADYIGVSDAAALNSCTAGLHLALVALGLEAGDEVITTPMTFCASVNAIIHAGGTPVVCDIDPVTMNIDPAAIKKAITPKTKAILPVHFAGRPCEMDEIMAIAEEHNLKVVEDCAHAIESTYKGRHAGTIGDLGCFSFYVTKNIVTGEGGMVIARKDEDLARIKTLGLHGMSHDAWNRFGDDGYKHYQVVEAGFKYNMMDIQAAIGIHQLTHVDEWQKRRQQVWAQYQEAFADLPLTLPSPTPDYMEHAHHLYTILVDEEKTGISRDKFLTAMTAENIGVGVHYLSVPEHPFYQKTYGWDPNNTPHATRVGRQTVSLPLSAKLNDDDVQDVIAAVHKVLGK